MAMATECGGCGSLTSWICAAQFCNGPNEHVIICINCWEKGKRCFIGPAGLIVANEKPNDEFSEATLYWDEGNHVTGGKS